MSKEVFGVNDGHTLSGVGSGAVGRINESENTRKVGNELRKILKEEGQVVYNCTVDKASSVNESLDLVVKQANREELDWFISIHFNAGGGEGVEVYTYEGRQYQDAIDVCKNISALGFKNRGVKKGTGLYVIRKTKAKSMLIEVCFVDTNDANKYLQVGYKAIAKAIAEGILGKKINTTSSSTQSKPQSPTNTQLYRVRKSWTDTKSQKGAYSDLNNAIKECNKHSGYKVYDEKGNQVHPKASSNTSTSKPPTSSGYKLVSQKGKCTWNTSVQIRENPSTKAKSVGQYNKGQTVIYDHYVDNEGYRWISWIGASGKRRYSAVRVLSTNKKYGNCV